MNTTTPTTRSRRLVRSRDVAGVCGGPGEHLGIDATRPGRPGRHPG